MKKRPPEIRDHRERQERASRVYKGKIKRPAGAVFRQEQARRKAPSRLSRFLTALKKVPWLSILFWTVFVAAVVLQVFILRKTAVERETRQIELEAFREEQELLDTRARESVPDSCEIRYLVPGQEDLVEQIPYGGTATLHDPVELEGYTFLSWIGPDGEPETRKFFTLYEDMVLTARYALPLETEEHIPYLEVDSDGVVDVDANVTVREFVRILYKLLNIDLVGQGTFFDVEEEDSCYKAAATLKDLGILEGNYLYPDELLLEQEMLQYLERFYPASDAQFDFPGLDPESEAWSVYCTAAAYGWIDAGQVNPESTVTRGALARVLNRVLGRGSQMQPGASQIGMILDVAPGHPYYADIAEAVIPHTYIRQDSVEVWTSSEPLSTHEPGLFFAGVRLHCINDYGRPLVNTTYDGRTYNQDGEVTSGDPDLDRELWAILEDTVDPDEMDNEEMLKLLYDYVCDHFDPCSDTLYEVGAQGWAVKEAKRILSKGEASSYGYAALFYELAYMIGYQPALISGTIYGTQTEFESEDGVRIEASPGQTPHAWVEIKYEGISYIFDPAGESRVDPYRQYYHRNEPIRWQRGYRSDVF